MSWWPRKGRGLISQIASPSYSQLWVYHRELSPLHSDVALMLAFVFRYEKIWKLSQISVAPPVRKKTVADVTTGGFYFKLHSSNGSNEHLISFQASCVFFSFSREHLVQNRQRSMLI